MIATLRKLKGRSFAEIADRGRQHVSAFAERLGISKDLQLPSDTAFLRLFRNPQPSDFDALLRRLRSRGKELLPSFDDRDSLVSTMRSRFATDVEIIKQDAGRVLAGQFDLLGHIGLEFGSPVPDWHREPLSGKRSPLRHWAVISETDAGETGDKKVVWELNRHQYFAILGRAYLLTGDEVYAEAFVSHVEDWIEKNPPKMGVNWKSSLEIAYRSISWIWAIHFFRDSERLGSAVFARLLKCLYLNGRHLERNLSLYSSPNTHLTGEALGLYMIGSLLCETEEGEKWRIEGYRLLMNALNFQIREDGGYVEQSTHYHRYTADIYLFLYIVRRGQGEPISEPHELKLRKMLRFLAHLTGPDGETALVGDDDGGRLHFFHGRRISDFRSTLAVGSVLLNDPVLKYTAGEASPEILWLTGTGGLAGFDRIDPVPPKEHAIGFKNTGWYIMRDGWESDSNFAMIDCGEHGFLNGGHAHADALGLIVSANGLPVLVDSGTYTYTGDPGARNHFRSSLAHNCLTVNGESSSIPGGPFSWQTVAVSTVHEWRVEDDQVYFHGSHNGFERFGVKYERELTFFPKERLVVSDRVSTISSNEFAISFVLSLDIEAEILDPLNVVLRTKIGKRRVLTIVTKVIEQNLEDFDGWRSEPTHVSRRYGSVVATEKLVFELKRASDFLIENSLIIADRA